MIGEMQTRFYFVHYHDNDTDDDWDLIVEAYCHDEVLQLWRAHWKFEDDKCPTSISLIPPLSGKPRAVSWHGSAVDLDAHVVYMSETT